MVHDVGWVPALVNVSVVIVTRGDVDLAPIIGQDWPDAVQEIVVWNNADEHRRDLKVYGRYAAIAETNHPLIYVQDDDCTLERDAIEILIRSWAEYDRIDESERRPRGDRIVANMPQHRWFDYPDSCLIGWGSVFHRDAPARSWKELSVYLHERVLEGEPDPWLDADFVTHFNRTCDVVFTTLTPHVKLDLGFKHLPWAEGPDRMFKQPDHKDSRDEMLALARKVRDA